MRHLISIYEYIIAEGRWGHVGAGILPYCTKTNKFLISLRSRYVLEPNTWNLWGGKIEDVDETVERSALREFRKETGYNGQIKLIKSYIYKEKNFTYYNFIGIVNNEFIPNLDWETQDFKWMSLDDLIKLEPKHFGLKSLLDNNLNQLKKL